jgi:glycosyltransferase involved in cell wall biosynthesis
MKISAVIITLNEEKNLARCLDSVRDVVDEIVILDSFSGDRTEEIAVEYGVKFIKRAWKDFSQSKNYANAQASHDYILSLDADEALSDELAETIRRLKENDLLDGYFVNRRTNYCGKWITHCGWYPDQKLRLWNRKKGQWEGAIHEKIELDPDAKTAELKGDLLHYAFNTIAEHIETANRYSDIAARDAYKNGKKANLLIDIILNPVAMFLRKYVLLLGFMDGYYGYIICRISAFANFLKYSKLRSLNRQNTQ